MRWREFIGMSGWQYRCGDLPDYEEHHRKTIGTLAWFVLKQEGMEELKEMAVILGKYFEDFEEGMELSSLGRR